MLPSCDIAITRKVVQVYRKWILQDKPVFMEEPDKNDVVPESTEKLGFSETDCKEVLIFYHLFKSFVMYISKCTNSHMSPVQETLDTGKISFFLFLSVFLSHSFLLHSLRICFSDAALCIYSRLLVISLPCTFSFQCMI